MLAREAIDHASSIASFRTVSSSYWRSLSLTSKNVIAVTEYARTRLPVLFGSGTDTF